VAQAAALSLDGAAPTDALDRYRGQVERVFNRISLSGLPERDPGLSELPLVRVFISLSVEVQQVVSSLRYHLVEGNQPASPSVLGMGSPSVLGLGSSEESIRAGRPALDPPHPPEPLNLSLGEALHRFRRLIIIGDPGSGKTTLLRWLAVTFATRRQADQDRLGPNFSEPLVPILLELRRFAERLRALAEQPAAFNLADEISSYIANTERNRCWTLPHSPGWPR
jgi:NACHT domain